MPTRDGPQNKNSAWEEIAQFATHWTGSTTALVLALASIMIWLALGPVCDFSDTWQLVINTGTTIVTFLMVFLIQRSQNKDSLAIQLKLNEIVAALDGASNRLINVENHSEAEVKSLHREYERLAELARREVEHRKSHSIEETTGSGRH